MCEDIEWEQHSILSVFSMIIDKYRKDGYDVEFKKCTQDSQDSYATCFLIVYNINKQYVHFPKYSTNTLLAKKFDLWLSVLFKEISFTISFP